MISCHTDVVGSLLRPPELLAAREDFETGRITQADLEAIEDRAVDDAVARKRPRRGESVHAGTVRVATLAMMPWRIRGQCCDK